jgi:hypothetical protein
MLQSRLALSLARLDGPGALWAAGRGVRVHRRDRKRRSAAGKDPLFLSDPIQTARPGVFGSGSQVAAVDREMQRRKDRD